MIVYSIPPIDYWSGWQKPERVFRLRIHWPAGGQHDAYNWRPLWEEAQELAHQVGWEGDVRPGEGPFVTVLPCANNSLAPVVIAWKQENGGATFVASEIELPWLNKYPSARSNNPRSRADQPMAPEIPAMSIIIRMGG